MTRADPYSEDLRKVLHIGAGSGALLLPFVPWWLMTMGAAVTVTLNAYWLPRLLGPRIHRPTDLLRGLYSGIVLYPAAVLALLLVLPERLDIVAATWGILAAGDGMATIAGRHIPSARIPWNRGKSIAGSLAFIVFGGAAGAALAWWCRTTFLPPAYLAFTLGAPVIAAIAAAAAETIPINLDDNISTTATAGSVLWALSLVSRDLVESTAALFVAQAPLAIGVNAVAAIAGYATRTVSTSGAIVGFLIGTIILVTVGWSGWVLLFLALAAATVVSRIGLGRKAALTIEQENDGRRTGGSAFGNTGLAAIAALMSAITYAHDAALVAMATALVASASDTVASEIGKAFGGPTFSLTSRRRMKPGSPGGVSTTGTVAGIVAALILAGVAVALGLIGVRAVPAVVLGAMAGSFAESACASAFEPSRIVNNDVLNFINTVVAVAVALHL